MPYSLTYFWVFGKIGLQIRGGNDLARVALVIDWQNIYSSMLNLHHQYVDPVELMILAKEYGPIGFARAYGDLSKLARITEDRFSVAGIQFINCPYKQVQEKQQSTVDHNIVQDLLEIGFDREDLDTIVMMSGDGDFLRALTTLKNRFNCRIVVCGVSGTVNRLMMEVGEFRLINPAPDEADTKELIRIINLVETSVPDGFKHHIGALINKITSGFQDQIDPRIVRSNVHRLHSEGILITVPSRYNQGGEFEALVLNRDHPEVVSALGLENEGIALKTTVSKPSEQYLTSNQEAETPFEPVFPPAQPARDNRTHTNSRSDCDDGDGNVGFRRKQRPITSESDFGGDGNEYD